MKKITLTLLSFLLVSSVYAQMDSSKIAQLASIELSKISTVIEGEVLDIEYFAGDEDGNLMPEMSIVWDNQGYGYYMLPNGKKASGYTLSTVKVCQVYKGNELLDTIQILCKPTGFQVFKMPYLDRDTTWYDFRVNVSDQWPRKNYLGPRNIGYKSIFFCYNWENEPIDRLYKLSVFGGFNFNPQWNPNAQAPNEDYKVFSNSQGLFTYYNNENFFSRQEMNDFLVAIPILELDVTNNNSCVIPNVANNEKKM